MSIDLLSAVKQVKTPCHPDQNIQIRIGIHSGIVFIFKICELEFELHIGRGEAREGWVAAGDGIYISAFLFVFRVRSLSIQRLKKHDAIEYATNHQ